MKKQLITAMVAMTLTFTGIPSLAPMVQAEAATTATQSGIFWTGAVNLVKSIGTVYDNGYMAEAQAVKFTPKDGATYSATSDKSSVVKITATKVEYDKVDFENVGKVFVTGVTAGSANVTLKESYNGKTKVVGTVKVTIAKTDINVYSNPKHEFGLGAQDSKLKFVNRNDKATYSFKANKPGLTFSTKKEKQGYHTIQMNATQHGTYIVSAYETYNGVTRKIKDITFHINPTVLPGDITVKSFGAFSEEHIKFMDMNYEYGFFIKGQPGFTPSGGTYITFDESKIGKAFHTDYNVFSVANKDSIEMIGSLYANKPTTVEVELWRIARDSQEAADAEMLKTLKVTFKF